MSEWNGPVLATSIKTDVLHHTLAARSELGEAPVFDPTQATSLGHAVWSPLSASTTWTGARRTSAALLGVGEHRASQSADDAFWRPAWARYLAALRFAATKAADNTMADVLHWMATTEFDEPTKLLDESHLGGTTAAIDSIQSVKGTDQRFVSSLLQTIATAVDPWQEPQVAGATVGESRISADWMLSGATGPGQGVHLLCVLQNISQGYDRWGRDRAETIIANHRSPAVLLGHPTTREAPAEGPGSENEDEKPEIPAPRCSAGRTRSPPHGFIRGK